MKFIQNICLILETQRQKKNRLIFVDNVDNFVEKHKINKIGISIVDNFS
jgi:hypothetical protein